LKCQSWWRDSACTELSKAQVDSFETFATTGPSRTGTIQEEDSWQEASKTTAGSGKRATEENDPASGNSIKFNVRVDRATPLCFPLQNVSCVASVQRMVLPFYPKWGEAPELHRVNHILNREVQPESKDV
jgi:hypothetical protein